jgi:hypothetical protein
MAAPKAWSAYLFTPVEWGSMLNVEVNGSSEGVERYFDRELAVSDYLMKEPGVWAGLGAETPRTARPWSSEDSLLHCCETSTRLRGEKRSLVKTVLRFSKHDFGPHAKR